MRRKCLDNVKLWALWDQIEIWKKFEMMNKWIIWPIQYFEGTEDSSEKQNLKKIKNFRSQILKQQMHEVFSLSDSEAGSF